MFFVGHSVRLKWSAKDAMVAKSLFLIDVGVLRSTEKSTDRLDLTNLQSL